MKIVLGFLLVLLTQQQVQAFDASLNDITKQFFDTDSESTSAMAALATLKCQVVVVSAEETFDDTFGALVQSQGHGAPEQTFDGKTNQVTVMADGKWLGVSWRKNGELIAESISLIRDSIVQPRVLMLYNPKNTDEQASLDCAQ